ncbi:hypothetical protein CSG_7380 [Campylobacter fetus subsp. venerealis str. 84-112]|nr:hypothetical protein CSG_7380 [Campylobacter fetus subsp. venerealis str. 84-112]
MSALDSPSFVNLVKEYKDERSKIFFSEKGIKCIIDFNSKDRGEFRERHIDLNLQYTPFYEAFDKSIGSNLEQRDFVFLLKSLFMFIKKIDNKPNDNMDVIELAESLQAVKKFDSIQKNSSSKINIETEIKSGAKSSLELPRHITFELPIYEADTSKLGEFETELFVDIDSGGDFALRLVCFTQDMILRNVLDKIVDEIANNCGGVPAFKAAAH